MRESRIGGVSFGRSGGTFWLLVCWLLPAVVLASETPDEAPPLPAADARAGTARGQGASDELDAVIVTGSRIQRDGFVTPAPMTVVTADEIRHSGAITLGELLNELPALRSTFSLSNASRFLGGAGLNLLDLRGMGANRTLVLVNGRRHVGGTPGTTAVDLNTIPIDWVERVEVITGGASAIYGADAVTGVVNIVLKRDFEGVGIRAQSGGGVDGGFMRTVSSLSAGRRFADGRGSTALAIEFSSQERLDARGRNATRRPFRTVTLDPADAPPDRRTVPDAGPFLLNERGVVVESGFAMTFSEDGQVIPMFGPDAEIFPSNDCSGCEFLDLTRTAQLQPGLDRFSLNHVLDYRFSPNFNVFAETKFAHVRVRSRGQPAFDFGDGELIVRRDNAFLPEGLAEFMDGNGLDRVQLTRFNEDAGRRGEKIGRDTFRIVLGADGVFGAGWQYEASLNYGRTEEDVVSLNNRINDRWFAATDAVIDPRTGEAACRIDVDADATLPSGRAVDGFVRGGNCMPVNIFGPDQVDAAALGFFNTNAVESARIEQRVASAHVAHPGLFELPAGPLGVALGAEHRREESSQETDALSQLGITFLNATPPEDGDYHVSEAFGEISLPILAGLPWMQLLQVEVAGRFADYSTVGSTFSWKVGGEYLPDDNLRLRATYARAVRAPNITELFGPRSQNFFQISDPCSASRFAEGVDPALREANCTALGRPADFESRQDAATRPGFSGGNRDLREEEAHTWTAGFVLAPVAVPGLALSVDFWRIKLTDAIAAPGAQQIVNRCVDSPGGVDNPFCDLISRDPGSFEIDEILQIQQNIAALVSRGIDAEASYNRRLFGGNLAVRTRATKLIERQDFPFASEPGFSEEQRGTLGDPNLSLNSSLVYQRGPWTGVWEMRYFDRMLRVQREVAAANPDTIAPLKNGSVLYHDIQSRYRLFDAVEVYVGVNNLFDREMPLGVLAIDGATGLYDNVGRFVFGGIEISL